MAQYLVLTVLTVLIPTLTYAGDVASARCRVRCLVQLKSKLFAKEEVATFERCFQDISCTACLQPCGYAFDGLGRCLGLCQETDPACLDSCRFLDHLQRSRSGTCPAVETGLPSNCLEPCEADADCDELLKCCNISCGYTCVPPHDDFIGVPRVPEIPSLREKGKPGVVELRWKAVETNTSVPILYMVQERFNIGRHHSLHHVTPWTQVAQTTATSSVMRDVGAGRWYQWRVASVAINGTRGFSPPTKPYKTSIEPEPPTPPQNITEGPTIIKDKKIYLTVHWLPPKYSDLPVTRYKLFWSRHVKGDMELYENIEEHRKVVPWYVSEYEIENLLPETTYFIQIQAISSYGEERLKSAKIHMFVKTYSLEYGTQNEEPTVHLQEVPLVTLSQLQDIRTSKPFFNNGLLKSNVSWSPPEEFYKYEGTKILLQWSPEVCIAPAEAGELPKSMSASTKVEFFILYDLQFDCRYTVKLQMVATGGQVSPVTTVSFQTPSCLEVKVVGDVTPDCPTLVPQVPLEPQNLEHSFLIMQTNITARISWQHPSSDVPIIGYRVVWGQAAAVEADEPSSGQMEPETSLTKVISKDSTSISIESLQEATSYIVHLQAMSQAGSGKVSTIHFTTPVLQPQPIAPPYKPGADLSTAEKSSPVSMETWAAEILHPHESHDFFWSCATSFSQSACSLLLPLFLLLLLLNQR